MFSSEILSKEYEKNKKIYDLIIQDNNINENIKNKYKKYLEDREKEINKEKQELEKLLIDLRNMYKKEKNEYLRIELEKNINLIIKKI